MRKTILFVLTVFVMATIVKANILITEIMYNPNQADDSDAEWVELYNNGNTVVDLSSWQINGKTLSGTIPAKQYMVIARELIDSNDIDTDSFESIWGNNDNVWDYNDGFSAIDSSLTLPNSYGYINLSNGTVSEFVAYSSDWGANGNGKTLERINLSVNNSKENWNESVEATPGMPNYNIVALNEISFSYEIKNVPPVIDIKLSPDEMVKNGVQVIANNSKQVKVTVYVKDDNGVDDIKNITAETEGMIITMQRIKEMNDTIVFGGIIEMSAKDKKKEYVVKVTVFDGYTNSTAYAKFEYVGSVSIVLQTRKLNFGTIMPGQLSDVKNVIVKNKGTVAVKLNVTEIEQESNIEIFKDGKWTLLTGFNYIAYPGDVIEIKFRVNAPRTKARQFSGRIKVIANPVKNE